METAIREDDFVALVTTAGEQKLPSRVILRTGIIFNRAGTLELSEESVITGSFAEREIR